MKRFYFLLAIFAMLPLMMQGSQSKFKYDTVPGDPLKTRIYTLDNGLKIFLAVNKDQPRIQTYIGVRVGAKNDPAETTGLAHYFEHLMFKGTKQFGTSDYAAEEPLLDRIEALFEQYRKTTDEAQRKAIYAEIDNVSQQAARISIPNEYDKLMSAIGSEGTNAFTSYDATCYIENIPSNELDTWAEIQADRFANPVIRGFHTELETVYEEYNMSLTRDGRKIYQEMLAGLYPHHPSGQRTVLGTQEHLKNPSITNIKNYFKTYYVPNNMAVIMVGDLDPDQAVETINRHFGSFKPGNVPPLKLEAEQPITAPIIKEIVGRETDNLTLAFRLPAQAANARDMAIMDLLDYLMSNGTAGLIDLNINQQQKMLGARSGVITMADYSIFQLAGTPKEGQTLDEVRDLLLEQVELLKKGEFDDKLLEAVINNFRLNIYNSRLDNNSAAMTILYAYLHGVNWADAVNTIEIQSKLTKKDIVDFANRYLGNNYLAIYKRKGDPQDPKIDKPQITPIPTNRDSESQFLARIKARNVEPIQPVFVDYTKDLTIGEIKKGLPLLYKQNTTNPTFSLHYVFEMGNNHDKVLGTAFNYLSYLGTSKMSAEAIKSEFYRMACQFGVTATNERVYVTISGLSDNFDKALDLLEQRLNDAVADRTIYDNRVKDILKQRADAKLNQQRNFSMLSNYAVWGAKSPATNILSEAELKALDPEQLVARTKDLKNIQHTVMYYGPLTQQQLTAAITAKHMLGKTLRPVPAETVFTQQETPQNEVLLANYDAKQIYLTMYHKAGKFDKAIEPERTLYNAYFGGGMNSIVFQEMREARALAYSAGASYQRPGKPNRDYSLSTFIATQNDKMQDAVSAFHSILNDMPESEKAFNLAKERILTGIRTERVLRDEILWNYLAAKEFGYTTDARRELFEKIPGMTLENVKAFQQKYVKNKPFKYCILGNTKELDMQALEKLGKVRILTQEEIFGY